MITDYMMIPQIITKNTWENLLDIWQTSNRRKIKDTKRRIMITDSPKGLHVVLQKRDDKELKKKLSTGLWRMYAGFTDWRDILDLHVESGLGIFTINSFNFEIQMEELNPYQVTTGIIYEPRNVFAEEAGSIPPAISLTESWSYPENGIAGYSN